MLPRHPYMIRALYDWLVDSGDVPHLLVDAEREGVQVPTQYVQEGRIVLNVGPDAVQNLSLGNEYIIFNARFGGKPMEILLPQECVIAIYGRDSGEGMMFNLEDMELSDAGDAAPMDLDETDEADGPQPVDTEDDGPDDDGPGGDGKKKRRKPNLKIIK